MAVKNAIRLAAYVRKSGKGYRAQVRLAGKLYTHGTLYRTEGAAAKAAASLASRATADMRKHGLKPVKSRRPAGDRKVRRRQKRSAPLNPSGILFGKDRDKFFRDHFEFVHVK